MGCWLFGCFKWRKRLSDAPAKEASLLQVQQVHDSQAEKIHPRTTTSRGFKCQKDIIQSNPHTLHEEIVCLNLPNAEEEKVQLNSVSRENELDASTTDADPGLERSLSTKIKKERRRLSAGKRSSDAWLHVDQLEEEIESLNQKLEQEADQAQSLTNEIKSLKKWSKVLDSPHAFKNALENLGKGSEDHFEEDQKSLLLQSLGKIELEEAVEEPSTHHKRNSEESLINVDRDLQAKSDLNTQCTEEVRLGTAPVAINVSNDLKGDSSIEGSMTSLADGVLLASQNEKQYQLEHSYDEVSASFSSELMVEASSTSLGSVSNGYKSHNALDKDSASFKANSVVKLKIDSPSSQGDSSCVEVIRDRRSCSALSFSGFILVEDEATSSFSCEQVTPKESSKEELSGLNSYGRNIEQTDLTGKHLDEASKCLFAFSPEASQAQPVSVVSSGNSSLEATSMELFHGEMASSTDTAFVAESETASFDTGADGNKSVIEKDCFAKASRMHRCSEHQNSHLVHLPYVESFQDSSQVPTSDEFLELSDALSEISSECSIAGAAQGDHHLNVCQMDDASSCRQCQPDNLHPVMENGMSEERKSILQSNLAQQQIDEESSSLNEGLLKKETFKLVNGDCSSSQAEQTQTMPARLVSSDCDPYATFLESTTSRRDIKVPCTGKSSLASQGESYLCGDSLCLVQQPGPDSQTTELLMHSQCHKPASRCIKASTSSTISSSSPQIYTPPTSSTNSGTPTEELTPSSSTVASSPLESQTPPYTQLPISGSSSNKCTVKLQFTPSRKISVSVAQVETPANHLHNKGSPSNLAEDRPILGMVAAHWSHATTKKWWDGKGIPNSTNKYKEDQKVSWHATPFEVRLERALAKQDRVFQKKLFAGAMTAEIN